MSKAVIYARVSTKDQEQEGYSIPAQLRALREYANKNGLSVIREFMESESAGKAGRTAFGEMIDLLNADKSIAAILVEKTDRLYRNYKDKVIIEDLDINVHFVKDNRVIGRDSKPSDKFVNDIETAQARFYLNNLSDEVKKGLNQKALQGQYPGGPTPLGYIRNRLSGNIEVDIERSPIIRRLYELYSTGEYSLDDIHKEAKKLGLSYRKSNRIIARCETERILKRIFYTGRFNWKGQVFAGDHPAIIDYSLFNKVQESFKRRSPGGFSRRSFTFNRLITCGSCNHTVTAEIKKRKYIYYHCTGYGNLHKPEYVPEVKIDSMFASIVGQVTLPYDFYDFIKTCLEHEFGNRKVQIARERERLELDRDKIQTSMKKAYQDKVDGFIDDFFFKGVFNDYQNRLMAIEHRLAVLPSAISEGFDIARQAIELSYQAESLYLSANPDQKRRLLKSLLSNCILKDATLYPIYRKPFDIFAEGIKTNNKRG